MADNQVILAVFADEAAADAAVESLKAWDKASDDIKLGAIGVLVLDDKGALKVSKMGQRSTKKGAGIGLVLAIVAPPTLLAGLVGGGSSGPSTTRDSASRMRTRRASARSLRAARPPSASSQRPTRPARSSASSPSWVARLKPST